MTRSRDVRPYLEGIADSIARIGRYTEGIGVDDESTASRDPLARHKGHEEQVDTRSRAC